MFKRILDNSLIILLREKRSILIWEKSFFNDSDDYIIICFHFCLGREGKAYAVAESEIQALNRKLFLEQDEFEVSLNQTNEQEIRLNELNVNMRLG